MPESRDSTTADIDFFRISFQGLNDRKSLHGEGFINFNEVDVLKTKVSSG